MRLYITRHGETEWNLQRRYQGQGDSPLTGEGVRQARSLARRLAPLHLDAAYSSDLGRARRTAELLLEGRGLAVNPDPAWRERAYGRWEGMTREEVAARYPVAWRRREVDRAGSRPPGGESLIDVQRRVVAALEVLRSRHAGDSVLVVTHAGSLWALACALFGDDLATSQRPHVHNCALSCLHWDDAGLTTECWDDAAHLSE